jgi:transketolase
MIVPILREKFGFSAPGDIVMTEYGMTPENLIAEIATMN